MLWLIAATWLDITNALCWRNIFRIPSVILIRDVHSSLALVALHFTIFCNILPNLFKRSPIPIRPMGMVQSRSVRYFSDFIDASANAVWSFSRGCGDIWKFSTAPNHPVRAPIGSGAWIPGFNYYSPKNKFSTSAFDMQNHQLPHVDSSLLNLKICARIVIQSIPTNQLRPQNFKNFRLVKISNF